MYHSINYAIINLIFIIAIFLLKDVADQIEWNDTCACTTSQAVCDLIKRSVN